ncbi:MAG: tetratricopeptide repeat protein [Bacteroidota bacterium]
MYRLFITITLIVFKAEAQDASALRIADSLYALGNYSKAITFYEKVDGVEVKLAKSYEALGNKGKALAYYREALRIHPSSLSIQYNYGKLLFNSAQYREADSIFKLLSNADERNPNFPYHLGLIKEKRGDTTAWKDFSKVLWLDPNHQNALYKTARRLVEKRIFVSAVPYIDRGLEADPNSIRFLNLQALTFFHNNNYHGALDSYKKLEELGHGNQQLHENMAVCFSKTNQYEKAIDHYTILINQYDDTHAKWHYQIAGCFSALRYDEKAQRHLEIAIVLKDISTEAEYWSLSQLFGRQKKYAAQMDALRKVIAQNPKNDNAHYFLATAADNYFQDKKEAIPYYERYLKKFEKGKFIQYARQRIADIKTQSHFKD